MAHLQSFQDPIIDSLENYNASSLDQVKNIVANLSKDIKYNFTSFKKGYLMQCQLCTVYVKFSLNNNKIICSLKKTLHTHEYMPKIRKQVIDIQKNEQKKQKITINQKKTQAQQIKTLDQLQSCLKKKQYSIIWLNQKMNQNISDALLLISNSMEKRFKQYGEIVHYQFLKNTFRFQNHEFTHVGILYGWDNFMNMILFGFVFVENYEEDTTAQIMKKFIYFMNRSPETIITILDDNIVNVGINKLIQEGYFFGRRLFNWCQILRNIKIQLDDNRYKLYQKLILLEQKSEYQNLFLKIQRTIHSEKQRNIFQIIKSNHKCICQSSIEDGFIGIFQQYNMIIRDNIYDSLIVQNQLVKAIEIFTKHDIQQQLPKDNKDFFEKIQFQKYFTNNSIKNLRKKIERKCFRKFVNYYFLRSNLEVQTQCDENNYIVKEFKSNILYNVRFKRNKARCICRSLQKTGLPCSHIIRILEYKKKNIEDFMNKRWFVSSESKQNEEQELKDINI